MLQEYEEILNGAPYILLSIPEGQGVEPLCKDIVRMLGKVRVVLDAMAANSLASRDANQGQKDYQVEGKCKASASFGFI